MEDRMSNQYVITPKQPIKERFENLISMEPTTGCWLWMGRWGKTGLYGQFKIGRKNCKAHRVAYELYVEPIAEGKCVLHHCDTPPCCNPKHLFLGTSKDNVHDCIKKGRKPIGVNASGVKITEEQVRAIRKDTDSEHVMGLKYGIAGSHAGRIRRAQVWKHIQ
jgi:hypothetical protein